MISLLKQHGVCTCCEPGVPVHRACSNDLWVHVGDNMTAETFHVHIHSRSADCDGTYDAERTVRIPDYKGVTDPFELWTKAIELYVSAWGDDVKVTIGVDHSTGDRTAEIHENTDEGFSHTNLVGCADAWCAHGSPLYRDHRAEAAGY